MNVLDSLGVELAGTHLIEASAGTGKTYTITTLYLRLVVESGLEVSEILVVTYTKAATAELRQRIRERLREGVRRLEARLQGGEPGESEPPDDLDGLLGRAVEEGDGEAAHARLVRALSGFDEASIFTIHGFCQRVLQDNAFESGVPFESELLTDPRPLLREVAEDFWTRELYDASPALVRHVRGLKIGKRPFSPSILADLAAKGVTHPDMALLPERADFDLEGPAVAWRAALDDAAAIWAGSRNEVLDLLTQKGVLNGNSYREKTIRENWAPALDSIFDDPRPALRASFPRLANFTPPMLLDKANKGKLPPSHAFFDACERLLAADDAYAEVLGQGVMALSLDLVDFARAELDRRKVEQGTQTFDDLLQRLGHALQGPESAALAARVRDQFRAALIDEFQDTDPLQYRIFRTIWHDAGSPLFLIGDPKQAIYAFRGADVFAYMDACEDAGENRRHTLTTNWRSDPSLIAAVNAVFEHVPNPFVFERIPFDPACARPGARDMLSGEDATPLRILFVGGAAWDAGRTNESREALEAAVAADVSGSLSGGRQIDGRDVEPGDVAILCRTNRQAAAMQQALGRLGIPSVVQGDQSVFESREAEELERVLRAVAEPSDLRALRAALTTSLLGVSGSELHALEGSDAGFDVWLERFHAWHECWSMEGTIALIHRLFDDHDVQRRLLALIDGERRMTNLLHLSELLQATAQRAGVGALGLVAWLAQMRVDEEARAQGVGDAAQMRLESDARAVQLVTIHKSKGLEYPLVYCPYPWDGALLAGLSEHWVSFHDPDADDRLSYDLGSEDHDVHKGLAAREALAESLRLLYVALTRAQHQLVVVWAMAKDWRESALGYLLHAHGSVAGRDDIAPEALAEALKTALKGLEEADVRADLERLAEDSGGSVGVADLSLVDAPRREPATIESPQLEARQLGRSLATQWRTSSFSGLTAGGVQARPGAAVEPSAEGHDFDAPGPAVLPAETPADESQPVRLAEFPAGTGPGTMIHEVFEHLDFAQADDMAIAAQVERSAARHGVDGRFAPQLCRAIREQLDTPLGGEAGALSLSMIERSHRIDEMEFIFPVVPEGAERLTASKLARVFGEQAEDPRVAGYAERVGSLSFQPLAGHLRGFVDLIFEHAGRFYVVDYKSNRLGPALEHYAQTKLDASMEEHDYLLQYHVYVVALHRYLTRQLPGYDYDTHMGGVYYLFLRGMAPDHPEGSGIFHDRPPRALIEGLSELFAEGGLA